MAFDYFYGMQAAQFSFIRLPKILMTCADYSELSTEAKLLYGLLLDKMGESDLNKWFDDQGRVYVIYPIVEAQNSLGLSKKKAMASMADLEDMGLIERRHRGKGLPDMYYIKKLAA